ncbi:MAG: S8 family peptidase [Terriglobales bacterium]
MADKRNYLLGYGERLAQNEQVNLGFGDGPEPYTFGEAKAYLGPRAAAAANSLDALPAAACPGNEGVLAFTLHPKYLSKSAYPKDLFREAGLRAIGSKGVTVTPRKTHLASNPAPATSVELFVAGPREKFRDLLRSLSAWTQFTPGAADIIKLEGIRALSAAERVKPIHSRARSLLFEMVLHAGAHKRSAYILDAFEEYLRTLGIGVDLEKRIDTDDLSFLPVRAQRDRVNEVARFAFLRVVREMPRLRELWPANRRGQRGGQPFAPRMPSGEVLDPTVRVAVFDGGQPNIQSMRKWVRGIDGDGVAGPVDDYLDHGCAVTSSLLFGSLEALSLAPQPFARIDHYRVMDAQTEKEPEESLYPVLKRIVAVLERQTYEFVNFSIGPGVPIDDDDVHPWTAKIDPLLSEGGTLASIAVGNSGERDAASGLNRIQPPSDCVNALSVGASDSAGARADYSSVGHGRCPGVMKPDGLVFGGTEGSPFWVVDSTHPLMAKGVIGTSFAAPLALRTAIGVRAVLGPAVRPLALKALLIHHAEARGNAPSEAGWGLLPTDVEELITCATGTAHVVYQGELDPKKFLRAGIPMPARPISALVTITATICIATPTDPEHPGTYTRSGLQIFFRKDRFNVQKGKTNPKPSSFFRSGLGMPGRLIRGAHQWETVRHESRRMRGKDLKNPCFDIHYNPREEGHDTAGKKIPYAMIVSVSSPGVKDLFDQIFNRYRFQLAELKPRVAIPILVRKS